jgi:hypothetical protein
MEVLFTVTPLISPLQLVLSQHAWEPTLMFQRLTALIERPHFAMVKGPMEFQMSAAEPHSQCAMVYQELMDTQVLIVLHHHFQHVVLITVDSQEETANSELAQHHQVLQLSCN